MGAFKACLITGCDRNAHCSAAGYRGWCSAHYQRWRVHGDPLGGGAPRGASSGSPTRFLNETTLSYNGDECLIWPFAKDEWGYGIIRFGKRTRKAHRVVCERTYGEPPTPEHEAAHSCGNGHLGCVNKKHLSWKTPKENSADRIMHGTSNRGERNWSSKLTRANVRAIRELLKQNKPQPDIAKKFGVSDKSISAIATGKTWSWLDSQLARPS